MTKETTETLIGEKQKYRLNELLLLLLDCQDSLSTLPDNTGITSCMVC